MTLRLACEGYCRCRRDPAGVEVGRLRYATVQRMGRRGLLGTGGADAAGQRATMRGVAALFAIAIAPLAMAAIADAETGVADCEATESTLDADATLAGAAGAYQLTLVGGRSGGKLPEARGTLVLMPSTFGPDAFSPSSSPLSGATDVDLRAVGAFPPGDAGSQDPAAPGVLVLESRDGDTPRILLRLGADANRPDSPLFDGSYAVLEVRRITASGFAGIWRSAVDRLAASGHFCAWRLGGEP